MQEQCWDQSLEFSWKFLLESKTYMGIALKTESSGR